MVLLQKVVLLPTVGSGLKYIDPQASDALASGSEVMSEKYTGLGVGVLVGVCVGVAVLLGVGEFDGVCVCVGVSVAVGVGNDPHGAPFVT